MKLWTLLLCCLFPFVGQGQIITTFAGNGSSMHSGDGGSATSAGIAYNVSGTFDRFGNYYFSEVTNGNRICKIDTAGIITTIAGTGASAYSGDGGPASAAKVFGPQGVAVDTFGNIFFAEGQDGRIRKIDVSTGIITTVAGNGTNGYGGDGGAATSAMLNTPWDICFDKKGNLYIAEANNYRVRKVNTAGIITTYAGNGINGYGSDGGLADTSMIVANGICIDDTGNIYVADNIYGRIRKIDTFGIISTFAGTGVGGNSGDGGLALSAQIAPLIIKIDAQGNLYMATNYLVQKIRVVNTSGIISTFAGIGSAGYSGDGGPATAAQLNKPQGIAFDACGNVYIADDFNHRVRKVTSSSTLTVPIITLSGISFAPTGSTVTLTVTVTNAGSSYIIHWLNHGIEFTTTTVPTVTYTKGPGVDTITARVVSTASYGCYDSTTSAAHLVNLSTTGVSFAKEQAKPRIYPNPANDQLYIEGATAAAHYKLFNAVGSTFQDGTLGEGINGIHVATLPPGLYLLEITHNNNYRSLHRFIKQ